MTQREFDDGLKATRLRVALAFYKATQREIFVLTWKIRLLGWLMPKRAEFWRKVELPAVKRARDYHLSVIQQEEATW